MVESKVGVFKETEIGLIPEDWSVVKLGDVAKVSAGGSAPQGEEYFKRGKYPFIRVQHIHNEDFKVIGFDLINDEAVKKYKLKLFPKGTIVFPKSGATVYLEKRALLPFDAYIVSHLCAVLSKDRNVLQKYVFHFLLWKNLAKKKESGYPTINLFEVKKLLLPLPPFPEQQKISKVLDTIQRAIENQDRIIETTKNLKKSLMQKLFHEGTKGEELKETEIGLIPKSWEVVRLGDDNILIQTQYGLSVKGQQSGKYPIIRMNNLQNGQIWINDLQFVDIDDKTFCKFKLNKGDILFNRTNSLELVGKASIFNLEGDFVFASYLIRLKTNSSILDPYFFNHYFNWGITQYRLKGLASRGVSQANISATKLKTFKIPLPPLPEQQEIANILSTIDRKIEIEQRGKDLLKQLFKTMLHKLMSGEIRLKDVKI